MGTISGLIDPLLLLVRPVHLQYEDQTQFLMKTIDKSIFLMSIQVIFGQQVFGVVAGD